MTQVLGSGALQWGEAVTGTRDSSHGMDEDPDCELFCCEGSRTPTLGLDPMERHWLSTFKVCLVGVSQYAHPLILETRKLWLGESNVSEKSGSGCKDLVLFCCLQCSCLSLLSARSCS